MLIGRPIVIFALVLILHLEFVGAFASFRSRILPYEQKWAKYSINGEEFSVRLPEAPSLAFHSRPNRTLDANHGMRIYSAYADGVVYLVISEDIPKPSVKLDTYVKEFVQTIPRYVGKRPAQLTFDHELQLDSFLGKRYSLSYYERIEGIVDFYMTKKHVYVVVAAGHGHEDHSVQQFLESFSLNEALSLKDSTVVMSMSAMGSLTSTSKNKTGGQIFSVKDVTRPAIVVSKPEPPHGGS